MLFGFIFSYLKNFFVVFSLSFFFILALRIGARDPLNNDATMTYHSATQNCICKPAGDRTLLWVGAFIFGASLVAWHHLTHWTKAVKVEDGRANNRLWR